MTNTTTPETQDPGGTKGLEKKQKTIITILLAVILVLIVFIFYVMIKNKNTPVSEPQNAVEKNQEAAAVTPTASESATPEEKPASSITETAATDTTPSNTESSAATSEKKPDLYVASYSFSKDPKSGEEFEVKIKIGNKGTAKAENFHWQWWATHAKADCEGKINSLAAGETKTVGCKFTYPSWSTYDTKAVVDPDNEVNENNEDNNVATKKVTPIHDTAQPDLTISTYSFNHPPKMGEAFTISISILNNGDAAAGPFWWEWWPTHASHACREEIDSLPAHGDKVVTCTYTYASWSTYATKAVVDADSEVNESNEGNNTHAEDVIPIH